MNYILKHEEFTRLAKSLLVCGSDDNLYIPIDTVERLFKIVVEEAVPDEILEINTFTAEIIGASLYARTTPFVTNHVLEYLLQSKLDYETSVNAPKNEEELSPILTKTKTIIQNTNREDTKSSYVTPKKCRKRKTMDTPTKDSPIRKKPKVVIVIDDDEKENSDEDDDLSKDNETFNTSWVNNSSSLNIHEDTSLLNDSSTTRSSTLNASLFSIFSDYAENIDLTREDSRSRMKRVKEMCQKSTNEILVQNPREWEDWQDDWVSQAEFVVDLQNSQDASRADELFGDTISMYQEEIPKH